MQAVNAEKIKTFDVLPAQQGTGQTVSGKDGSAFKDAIRKALGEKSEEAASVVSGEDKVLHSGAPAGDQALAQATVPTEGLADSQLAVLVSMMAEAEMTVAPVNTAQLPESGEKVVIAPYEVFASPPAEEKPQAQAPPQTYGAQDKQAPLANQAARENAVSQPRQQQTGGTTEAKGHVVSKGQAQTEKPVQLSSREITVKLTEAKQEAPREAKQEFSIPLKAQIPVDPSKVYVKVGEGSNLKSEKFAAELSEKLIARMPAGTQQFVIELNPADLGKILIKLVVFNGRAEIIMQCANPKTYQLVMANADAIRNIVEERTGLSATVTAKEGMAAYGELDQESGQNKQDGNEEQKDSKWAEVETNIFLQQLRLGLAETADTKT